MKDFKEWNKFSQELPSGNVPFPCQNTFKKCTIKTELCKRQKLCQKLYTKL